MPRKVLISWIGNTDLKASQGELRTGVGPIANAATKREFDEVHLLSDHKASESKPFVKWLEQESKVKAAV